MRSCQTDLTTVTGGSTAIEVQGSGMATMTGGRKGVNPTETCRGIPIINMVGMDTAAQRGQVEVESTVIPPKGRTVKTH